METKKKTYTLALGGVLLAIMIVCLYFAAIAPGGKMSLFAVASVCLCLMLDKTGIKGGLILYVAAGLLMFLIIPDKLSVLPFALFFGLYPLLKYYIDKLQNMPLKIVLKAAFMACVIVVCRLVIGGFFFNTINLPNVADALVVAYLVFMFALYEVILTGLTKYIVSRLNGRRPGGGAPNIKL